jgi:hypothetical protein
MSTFDMFFVGYVIAAMLLLLGVLAWVGVYARDRKSPARTSDTQVVQLTPAKRPSEGGSAKAA